MSLVFRRRKRLRHGVSANISGRGVSLSKRVGPLSLSSRGRGTLRIAKGLGFRFRL